MSVARIFHISPFDFFDLHPLCANVYDWLKENRQKGRGASISTGSIILPHKLPANSISSNH